MKVSSHFMQFESYGELEPIGFKDGICGGDGFLADLAYFFLDIFLVELDDG